MSLQNASLTTSTATAIYTSSGNNAISTIHICNTTGVNAYANIYMVPSTFTANSTNQIYADYYISPFNTLITQEKFALGNGDMIFANANVAGISATISYIGI
jgi:hypothetical protein